MRLPSLLSAILVGFLFLFLLLARPDQVRASPRLSLGFSWPGILEPILPGKPLRNTLGRSERQGKGGVKFQSCLQGKATLHNAWASVFATFPDRLDPEVDGYIALEDCSLIGQYRWIRFGTSGRWWRVRVADCLRPGDSLPSDDWLADVDYRIWRFLRLPVSPQEITLCLSPPPSPDFLPGQVPHSKQELMDRSSRRFSWLRVR